MISIKEKIAFGLGDTASNLIFQTVMLFLTFYYTDIVGLSPGAVGTMFLLVRCVDAITDPLMGTIADNTRTRWGSYRPYLLWLSLPFALASILAFSMPELSAEGKLAYAVSTYTLLMIVYTAINIPYSALGGVMTQDPQERVSLQSFRFVFAMGGGLIVTLFTLPLVEFFGEGNAALGYQYTMVVMGTLGMLMFLLCFAGTRERMQPASLAQWSLRQRAFAMWQNDQARILCVVGVILLTGMVIRGSMTIYYVKDYLQTPDSITLFITAGMLGSIAGAGLAMHVAKKVCKVKAYIGIQLATLGICLANYWVPADAFWLALGVHVVWSLVLQTATPMLWAMMADTIEYGEWKTGTRMTGLTYATIVFFIKIGVALGGAMTGWLLAGFDYQAGGHSEHASEGIRLSFTVIPGLLSLLVALVMLAYKLNHQRIDDIQKALASRA